APAAPAAPSASVAAESSAAPAGAVSPAAPALAVEASGAGCPAPPLPAIGELERAAALPDPFSSASGQRITTRAEWRCRRAEIAAQVQEYQHGPKPPKPSLVSGALDGTALRITAGEPGRSVSFSVDVARPPGAPPEPAVPVLTVTRRSALAPLVQQYTPANPNVEPDTNG